jgi:hypothetical protein
MYHTIFWYVAAKKPKKYKEQAGKKGRKRKDKQNEYTGLCDKPYPNLTQLNSRSSTNQRPRRKSKGWYSANVTPKKKIME